ncbi:hypothetical protein EYF80_051642 [Liparis tanakae]|uniref:Uncharacterized protein n=1 Tax=Liparis tanakae TaxID=230148 RepID=A0A4Z2FBP3_9TELE|nr:hypothetical protein EYF80_051642 [Liparis tanakae]
MSRAASATQSESSTDSPHESEMLGQLLRGGRQVGEAAQVGLDRREEVRLDEAGAERVEPHAVT